MHKGYIYRNIPKVFNRLYRSRIDSESQILQILLNANQAVRYHKIQGYGLKDSDFDDKPNCSRRIFNHRKKDLLNSYSIRKLKQSDKRSTYYQITPLGIIHLCKLVNDLKEMPFTRIFDVLKFYYEEYKLPSEKSYVDKLQNSWTKLDKIFYEKWYVSRLSNIVRNIEVINEGDNEYVINLKYKLFHDTDVTYAQYVISEGKYFVAHYPLIDDIEIGYVETTEKKLYYLISKFILKAIFHSLIYNLLVWDEALPDVDGITTVNQLPENIIGVADEFNNDLRNVIFLNSQTLNFTRLQIGKKFKEFEKASPFYRRFGKLREHSELTDELRQYLKNKNSK